MGASVLGIVAGVLTLSFAFRAVDKGELGLYVTCMATVALLSIVEPVAGFEIARSVARRQGSAAQDCVEEELVRERHLALMQLAAALAAGSALTLGVWAVIARPGARPMAALILLSATLVVQVGTSVLPAAAIGLGDFHVVAGTAAASSAISMGTSAALVFRYGVAGLALGQFLGVLIGRALLLVWHRSRASWLSLRLGRPPAGALARLGAACAPLLIVGAAGQLIAWADLVVVGVLRGGPAAATYRLGAVIPAQAIALLFRGYDVIFPRLARSSDEDQQRSTELLAAVFGGVAGAGLGLLIALRTEVVRLVGGDGEGGQTAAAILAVFCLVWAANVPAHVLGLLLIARGQQRILAPIVAIEAAANIGLTVILVSLWGPVGAAVATLLSLAACNLVVLPLVVRRVLTGSMRLLRRSLIPLGVWLFLSICLSGLAGFYLDARLPRALAQLALGTTLMVLAAITSGGGRARTALRASVRAQGQS